MSAPVSRPVCGLCGRRLPAEKERRVYSSWTGSYYCAPHMQDQCHRLRARLLREQQAAERPAPMPMPEREEEKPREPMQLALA